VKARVAAAMAAVAVTATAAAARVLGRAAVVRVAE
jgi:hypothetical protein